MALTATLSPSDTSSTDDYSVSLTRLYIIRAMFLLWAVSGFVMALPTLIDPDPTARGMLQGMLGGLWVMGFIGVRYPLQMIPILLFEFFWKSIWLLAFGIPQWLSGSGSPRLQEDLLSIGTGPIVFGLIIPWGYVYRHYIQQAGDRWR